MAIAEHNYEYEEDGYELMTGWHKATIVKFTEPKLTKQGNATGFFICLDVEHGKKIVERDVFLSFDHPNDFVTSKSRNIGAMLRMMFPAVTADADYIRRSFWLLFKTYTDKKTNETKESFFDYKRNVSLDGKTTLDGLPIENADTDATPGGSQTGRHDTNSVPEESGDDVPF